MKTLNARGVPLRGGVPLPAPLSPQEFRGRADDCQVVDARSILAFGGGHVAGAFNIALREEFATWAGWMLCDSKPILLIAETAADVQHATTQLYRIGLDNVVGFLRNGMTDWQNAGLPLEHVGEWTVHELDERRHDKDVVVLDVRGDDEVRKGRVPGAQHHFVAHLAEHVDELDRSRIIATYCGTGYRAAIAASVLKQHGFERVVNVPGSWTAWKAAGLPVEDGDSAGRQTPASRKER